MVEAVVSNVWGKHEAGNSVMSDACWLHQRGSCRGVFPAKCYEGGALRGKPSVSAIDHGCWGTEGTNIFRNEMAAESL